MQHKLLLLCQTKVIVIGIVLCCIKRGHRKPPSTGAVDILPRCVEKSKRGREKSLEISKYPFQRGEFDSSVYNPLQNHVNRKYTLTKRLQKVNEL